MRSNSTITKLFMILFILLIHLAAFGATINVNTTADEYNTNPSDCSLREAIQSANYNSDIGGCSASGSYGATDNIIIPDGTYILTIAGTGENNNITGDLDINSHINFYGTSETGTIIDGNDIDRVFHIHEDCWVTMEDFTVRNGNPGTSSVFETGGGISNDGITSILFMFNCTISENTAYIGGGISNDWKSSLFMTNCTVSGNLASVYGGGIHNNYFSDLTMSTCTISGNAASSSMGGGIYSDYYTTITFDNCTISENTALNNGGGIYNDSKATSTITFCTITKNDAANGDGIYNTSNSPLQLNNTIVAYNPGATGNNIYGPYTGSNNITSGDPMLGDLQNNGGTTETHALLICSPALGAASELNCSGSDQRGVSRPQPASTLCDIGAYESDIPLLLEQKGLIRFTMI